jgi:hypothetical protein
MGRAALTVLVATKDMYLLQMKKECIYPNNYFKGTGSILLK